MKIEEREESIKWSFRRVGEMNGLEKCIILAPWKLVIMNLK